MKSGNLRKGFRCGKWTLKEMLGRGGNGDVWRAVSEANEIAAVKFPKEHFFQTSHITSEKEFRLRRIQRFRDEIDFLLSHKGIDGVSQILDSHFPENPTPANRPWFATELGTPVTRWLAQQDERLSNAVSVICSVAKTLSKLHEQGKFHRDIKPDNILMVNGKPSLGDFGLVDFPGKLSVTEKKEILGPRFYIAPEMLSDAENADQGPTDVYSLAKTLWVLATGYSYPIPGEQRITEPALTLSEYVNHHRSRPLDYLIYLATRHSPHSRITISELHAELEAWLLPLTATEDTSKRVSRLAVNLRAIELRQQDARDRTTTEKEAAKRLLTIASEYLRPQLDILSQLTPTDFDGNQILPRLLVHDQSPQYWDCWPSTPVLDGNFSYIGSAVLFQQFCGLNGRSLCYCGGVRIALTDSGTVRITIIHAYGSINSDARLHEKSPWIEEFFADIGLPTTEKKMSILLKGFVEALPIALEGVIQMLDALCDPPPHH